MAGDPSAVGCPCNPQALFFSPVDHVPLALRGVTFTRWIPSHADLLPAHFCSPATGQHAAKPRSIG
ncbi:hypothetical protein NV64_00430 [Erwinia sp. B116]|nr:hypothetical protein NV64_00430 [Erwinia sp. B116]